MDERRKISLRHAQESDWDTIHTIRQKAWEVAYKHIYSQEEIKCYFDGQSDERRTWSATTYDHEETIVCYYLEEEKETKEDTASFSNSTVRTSKGGENMNSSKEAEEEVTKEESSSDIIGYIKWCFTKNGKGEILSLYIHPNHWNRNCGSMLWDYVMKKCQSTQHSVTHLDIWVLDRARSKEFYISRGCVEGSSGDYFIGEHEEKAVCYHKYFQGVRQEQKEEAAVVVVEERNKSMAFVETMNSDHHNDCPYKKIYVDVIVPVHNAEETIEETVHSAMKQTIPLHLLQENVTTTTITTEEKNASWYYDGYERHSLQNVHIDIAVCCYDDGSTDRSFELLRRLKDHYDNECNNRNNQRQHNERWSKQLLICQSHDGVSRGAGYARNRAASLRAQILDEVKTNNHKECLSFVCLLDSDDVMHEYRIAEQVSVMLNKPTSKERNATLLGCTFKRIPEDSTWHYTNWANNLTDERLLLERFREITVLQPTWMVTRQRFDMLGGYIDSLDACNTQEQQHGKPSLPPVYKLIHPIYDNAQSIRLAEDLRFFHAHLQYKETKDCPFGTLQLIRTHQPLLHYRHRVGQSQSSSTSRKLLLQLRAKAFIDTIVHEDPQWKYCKETKKGGFVIWGAGRDGKDFFKALPNEVKIHVQCFVDVDEKKIKSGYYVPPPPEEPLSININNNDDDNKPMDQEQRKKTKGNKSKKSQKIPIVHFSLLAHNDAKRKELMQEWMFPNQATLDEENSGRITKENPSLLEKACKRMKVTHTTTESSESKQTPAPKRPLHGLSKKDKIHHTMLEELKDLPVVVCVAMYRSNGILEKNVANIGRKEGFNLWHFS